MRVLLVMITLFLDIETLPGKEPLREEIASQITPPATYKKPETIQKWEQEEKPQKVEEAFRQTALKGHIGRILCIGYIKESPEGVTQDVITGEEPEILQKFWDVAKDANLFVGFNIFDFDLKFIIQRSIIYGVKPSRELNFARYHNDPIFDVMYKWVEWDTRDRISLDELARALGFESSKDQLEGNGSKVYDYYKEGRLEEIYKYCMADVEVTRKIYHKMNFSES